MTSSVAPELKPDQSQTKAWPTLAPDLADTEREEAEEEAFDPTQGRKVGSHPYDDPTQGRKLDSDSYEDSTQGRKVGSDPYDDPTRAR